MSQTKKRREVLISKYLTKACARLSTFSISRLVVGSSKAMTPQFMQNVSARARRMMMEARTWKQTTGPP